MTADDLALRASTGPRPCGRGRDLRLLRRKRLMGPEQKHFFTCFRRPNVPPANNLAERSLRPVVILRKVVHGTRSSQGLENHSVLRSLFETARRQGKKAHHFFLDLFTKNTPQAQVALYRNPLPEKPPPPLRC